MAARQLWVFLTEADVAQLIAALDARDPGLVVSSGRYLRGEVRDLLEGPQRLERREALPGERRYYLLHPKRSADIVVHEQPAGPFAGWSQIDEERTDCLVLRVPAGLPGTAPGPGGRGEGSGLNAAPELLPARLYAHTSFWRGGAKIRKRPLFAIWANQALRTLLQQLPRTDVKFVRAGNDARAAARKGTLRLTYLNRPIGVEGSCPPEECPPGRT